MKKPIQANTAKIRGLMAEHGFTQNDLAVWLNIQRETANRKMKGKIHFRKPEVLTIAKMFGVDESELMIAQQ